MMRATWAMVTLLMVIGTPWPASADWLFTGYAGRLFQVKTAASSTAPAETFADSTGFGLNFATAFPARSHLGFEFDIGVFPKALHDSDQLKTRFASRLLAVSTNLFYSPAVPRVRPYVSGGATFSFRGDHSDATVVTPSGHNLGLNGGGGLIAFVNQRFGARVDLRYFHHFGEFRETTDQETPRPIGWNNLRFIRAFAGVTLVL